MVSVTEMYTHKARCDKCNYREGFSNPLRSYEMPDGSTITIERTFVWCGACRAIRWGEELAQLTALERELTAIETKESVTISELSSWVDKYKTLEQIIDERVKELRERIQWRRGRVSSARCLECGSTDIVALPQSETRSGNDKWVLKEHPGCGGVITVLEQAVLVLDRRWIRYSPEGEKKQAYEMYPHKGAVPIDEA